MCPYVLLVMVLVGLFTPLFWILGFTIFRAFIIASSLVIGSAIIGTAWTLITVRLVHF